MGDRFDTDAANDAILTALARGEVPGCAEEEAQWRAEGRWPPTYTPAQLAAALGRDRGGEREACAAVAEKHRVEHGAAMDVPGLLPIPRMQARSGLRACRAVAHAIRARGTSGTDALDEVRRQVKRECAARYRQMQEEQRASLVAHGEYGSDARATGSRRGWRPTMRRADVLALAAALRAIAEGMSDA